MLTSTSVPMI